MGKLFASLAAVMGIAMLALPKGVLGAAFVKEIQKGEEAKRGAAEGVPPAQRTAAEHCRHCSLPLPGDPG